MSAISEDRTPVPSGYQVLLAPISLDEQREEKKIIVPDKTKAEYNAATMVFGVVDMGPEAFNRQEKNGSPPYCEIGDFVITQKYAGCVLRVEYEEKDDYGDPIFREFRLVSDEAIKATVKDPRGLTVI